MTDLYRLLFETSFNSISSKDIQNGSIAGQKSLYSKTSSDSLAKAIESIHRYEKQFSNQIKNKRDTQFKTVINLLKISKREDFDNYSGRLFSQLEDNGIYNWDTSILNALTELITYVYLSSTKEKPQVWTDLERAKNVTQFIFKKLHSVIELKIPSEEIETQLKIAVLSTFYDINAKDNKESKETNKEEK